MNRLLPKCTSGRLIDYRTIPTSCRFLFLIIYYYNVFIYHFYCNILRCGNGPYIFDLGLWIFGFEGTKLDLRELEV